jgi:GLPGLI family protein
MYKKIIYGLVLMVAALHMQAQTKFVTAGKIEYERKTNQFAFMDEGDMWDEMARKSLSKFLTNYFDLTFKGNRTLFTTGRDPDIKQNRYWGIFASENTIFSDLDSNKSITQRSIYSDAYLVSDSLRHIDWKITTEMRKIAGFDCRKAVGRVMDSIIVIAFYTDEILSSGGPESFSGLPGMILGLAIPRLHTTWYATKLQLVEVTDKELQAPRKGKKMTGEVYRTQVKEILKNWGEESVKRQWQFLL